MKLSDFAIDEKEIGRGGFGTVYKARWKDKDEQEVAIKKVDRKNARRLPDEIRHHKNTKHDNIVSLYGDISEDGAIYLVMEYCPHGSLRDYLRKEGALTPLQSAFVLHQLVKVLEYLHEQNIVHRDLSAGNILIHRIRSDGHLVIKICDFGLAKTAQGRAMHTVAGTPGYMAPQVANREMYGTEADVYSLGSVLYFMMVGEEPDRNGNLPRLREMTDKDGRDLICQLRHHQPEKRLALQDVKLNAFMRRNRTRSCSRDAPTSQMRRRPSTDGLSQQKRAITEKRQSIEFRRRESGEVRPPQVSSSRRTPEGVKLFWPLPLKRLGGREADTQFGRFKVITDAEATLTGSNGMKLLRIRVLSQSTQRIEWEGVDMPHFHSWETLSSTVKPYYAAICRSIMNIQWKVAKVVINNHPIKYPGGIVRLMENDDLRLTNPAGKQFNLDASTGNVTTMKENERVLDRELWEQMEELAQYCRRIVIFYEKELLPLPYVYERPTENAIPSSMPLRPITNGSAVYTRESRKISSGQRVQGRVPSRALSAAPSSLSSREVLLTHQSAPTQSEVQQKREGLKIKRYQGGRVAVVDEERGIHIRESTSTPNQFIVTEGGAEKRFSFQMGMVSSKYRDLLESLMSAKHRQ